MYKYKKGPQSTETHEQTETVTQRCNTDRETFFYFFFNWGYMYERQNHKDMVS